MEIKKEKITLLFPKNTDMQCAVSASLTQAIASFMITGMKMEESIDSVMNIYKTITDWAEEELTEADK